VDEEVELASQNLMEGVVGEGMNDWEPRERCDWAD
jgi:hypothetical protein